jgi:hypothetical protein
MRKLAAALAILIAPFTAAAQTAPEFPGLRGLTTIQAYIGFIGRTAAIAECGFTEPYVAELMANVGRELAQAGVTLTPGAEQVQMTDGLLLRSPGYTPGLPTLAITAGTLSVSAGGTSICAVAIGFVLRASGTGVNITATGNRFDGEVAVWIDDAAQLRDATSIPAAVRGSILQTIQGLVRSITAANAMAAACPGPIWGIDVYTDDSSVCVAAVHAGAIGPRGGTVTVSRAQGQQSYPGGARNGVVSNSYGPWQQSFRVTGPGGAAQPPAVNNQRVTK